MTVEASIMRRFWPKMIPEPNSGCWLWIGACNDAGYGQLGVGQKAIYAHRISYEHAKGPIPSGLIIDHLCRIRSCVNPDHLEAVTYSVNCSRGDTGGHNSRKTHCVNGHEFSESNTYVSRQGHRACRACHRIHGRKRQEQRKCR